jgi:hypothetical protein
VSFVAITLCVASQRVFVVVSVYFVIDTVRKLLDRHSYTCISRCGKDHPPPSIVSKLTTRGAISPLPHKY